MRNTPLSRDLHVHACLPFAHDCTGSQSSSLLYLCRYLSFVACFLLLYRVGPLYSDSNREHYGPTSFVIPIKNQVCFAHTKQGKVISRIRVSPAILVPSRLYVRGSYVHLAIIALLLTISGDIEINPGPVRFPCGRCNKAVQSSHRGICCDQCNRWFHVRCCDITNDDYQLLTNSSETWVCFSCTSLEHRQSQQHLQEPEIESEHSRFPCGQCHISVKKRGICCKQCNRWFHIRCASITSHEYKILSSSFESWICIACHGQVNGQHTTIAQVEPEREQVTQCHISTQRQANNL